MSLYRHAHTALRPFARARAAVSAIAAQASRTRTTATALFVAACAALPALQASAQSLTFTNRTTANGLGSDTVTSVYAAGSNVYAGTANGLSISSNRGSTFVNRTTADGLGSNMVNGVYAAGSNVYAGTANGLSISPTAAALSQPALPRMVWEATLFGMCMPLD